MSRLFGAILAFLLIAGCASVETVRDAKGQGAKRTFRQPYAAVFQATVNAASRRKLEFVEQNRTAGRILLSSGASWSSLGEHIAIFVTRTGNRATTVEIVSKPVLATVTFPPDWPALLFSDIEQELAASKAPK